MKFLERALTKAKSNEKMFLSFSYIVNVAIVAVMLMIATGISNITNESLNSNDTEQLKSILVSIVSVAAVTIFFFQWIISMQFRALFNSRSQFNTNIRLMGASPTYLYKIYLKEMFRMQPLSIVAGSVIGNIVYFIFAKKVELSGSIIGIGQLIAAALLHIIILTVCITLTFRKLSKVNVVDSMRVNDDRKSINKFNPILTIIGFVLFIVSIYELFIDKNDALVPHAYIGIIAAVFILFKLIMLLYNKAILKISRKTTNSSLMMSEFISIGYIKKSLVTCMLILFSMTLFCGLQGTFINVRQSGREVAEKNILFNAYTKFDELQDESDIQALGAKNDVETGLVYKIDQNDTVWYVYGVDSKYFTASENIVTCNTTDNFSAEKYDSAVWNGIIIPDMYATEKELGKPITINISGTDVDFVISGIYHSNNLAHWQFYASKSYISEKLSINNKYNIAFCSSKDDAYTIANNKGTTITKNELAEESYNKCVSGTALVEMVSVIIIICAMLSFINFVMLSSKNDTIDISRFKGLGMTNSKIKNIYIIEALNIILVSFIVSIPLSICLAKSAYLSVLNKYYLEHAFILPVKQMILVFAAFAAVAVITKLFAIHKALNNRNFVELLRDIND